MKRHRKNLFMALGYRLLIEQWNSQLSDNFIANVNHNSIYFQVHVRSKLIRYFLVHLFVTHIGHTFRIEIETIEWDGEWDRERNSKLSKPSWGQFKAATKRSYVERTVFAIPFEYDCEAKRTHLRSAYVHCTCLCRCIQFGRCVCVWVYRSWSSTESFTDGKRGIECRFIGE